MPRHMIISVLKPSYRSILSNDAIHALPLRRQVSFPKRLLLPPSRPFSSSFPAPEKTIVLEKPDNFRPPSHPARLNARRKPRHYPGPPIPEAEMKAQATRKYPHTFPPKGTRMHWFLTNKYIHLWISLGTLSALCCVTLTQSFLLTSPFANLTPPISTLVTNPISFIRDWLSVLRMHTEYNSALTAESRRTGIADAQKRRLYRRAHGMEDVEKEGMGEGIDVRGLVSWDDGLTRGERESLVRGAIEAAVAAREASDDASLVSASGDLEQPQQARRKRRPVKMWLGIW